MNVIFNSIITATAWALFIALLAYHTKFIRDICQVAYSVASLPPGTTAEGYVPGLIKKYIDIFPTNCTFGMDVDCPIMITNFSIANANYREIEERMADMTCENLECSPSGTPCTPIIDSRNGFSNVQEAVYAADTTCKDLIYNNKAYSNATG